MTMTWFYAKNANTYLNIYKIIKHPEKWLEITSDDIKIVQLSFFNEKDDPPS